MDKLLITAAEALSISLAAKGKTVDFYEREINKEILKAAPIGLKTINYYATNILAEIKIQLHSSLVEKGYVVEQKSNDIPNSIFLFKISW